MRVERVSSIRMALSMIVATLSIGGALAAVALAAVALAAGALAAGDTLRTRDFQTMGEWYGRAGGLVGSDRVRLIGRSSTEQVGIWYDQEVAKRTNMPRDEVGKSEISITYDKDVANRTNMQRDVPPVQSAGAPAEPRK